MTWFEDQVLLWFEHFDRRLDELENCLPTSEQMKQLVNIAQSGNLSMHSIEGKLDAELLPELLGEAETGKPAADREQGPAGKLVELLRHPPESRAQMHTWCLAVGGLGAMATLELCLLAFAEVGIDNLARIIRAVWWSL